MESFNVDLLKSHSIEEFKSLAAAFSGDVFDVAYCILLSPAQAHLVAEKTFIKAFETIDAYSEKISPGNWLCRIAYEEAVVYAKQLSDPTVKFTGKVSELSEDYFYNSKNNKIIDIENDVKLALSILPIDQREVLLLHDGYGFGYDRLSYIMGMSTGVLRSRTGLARSGIKNILFKKWNV